MKSSLLFGIQKQCPHTRAAPSYNTDKNKDFISVAVFAGLESASLHGLSFEATVITFIVTIQMQLVNRQTDG